MRRLAPHLWFPITAAFLAFAVYRIFQSGPTMTCVWGLGMAAVLYWMRQRHAVVYGATEIVAGLFILWNNYSIGRGGFSGAFNEAFQTFQSNVVLISILGAVYIMVRGFDNIQRGFAKSA
jgi:hypothetical protein